MGGQAGVGGAGVEHRGRARARGWLLEHSGHTGLPGERSCTQGQRVSEQPPQAGLSSNVTLGTAHSAGWVCISSWHPRRGHGAQPTGPDVLSVTAQ